jgi:sulfur relay (sulfurtransferase) DsrF/TusC family protein
MGKLFIAIAHDPSAGKQAQRGFLIASAAVDVGHHVSVFLAGGAVALLTAPHLDADAFGVPLRQHLANLLAHDGEVYYNQAALSGRGFDRDAIGIQPVIPADHHKIVELAFSHDRALTFG